MAEFVQQSIEEMLPELEQMERVDLFTSAECRAILKKRKSFEYKLRRRTKEMDDYLQYAQYEMNLLSLIKKRRERTGYSFKKLEIDIAVVQRIHKLFKLACWRFQDDVKLWLSHIEFCKMRQEKASVGRLFTKMMQIHSRKPELWILAAKWEMEENGSMENARGLLQRALRFNPKSKTLWQEYFRMELLNADKLHKRMEILGLAKMDLDDDEMSQAILSGQVALIVYSKAKEAFSDDVNFLLSLMPICRLFPFANAVSDAISNDLQEIHGCSELVWNMLALEKVQEADRIWRDKSVKKKMRVLHVEKMEGECWHEYEKAINKIPTERMWTFYLQACLDRLNGNVAKKLHPKRLEKSLSSFQRAHDSRGLSAEMALHWVEVLSERGDLEKLNALTDRLTQSFPASIALWEARLRTLAACGADNSSVMSALELALSKVDEKQSLLLWQFGVEWSIINDQDAVDNLFERAVLKSAEVSLPMKEAFLSWTAHKASVKHVRKLYKRLSASQPLSANFFKKYISIETEQLNPRIDKLRQGYEDSLREYGAANTDLWLDYARLEMSHPDGNPVEAGQIYFRAKKTLNADCIERFVTQYTLLQTGHQS